MVGRVLGLAVFRKMNHRSLQYSPVTRLLAKNKNDEMCTFFPERYCRTSDGGGNTMFHVKRKYFFGTAIIVSLCDHVTTTSSCTPHGYGASERLQRVIHTI